MTVKAKKPYMTKKNSKPMRPSMRTVVLIGGVVFAYPFIYQKDSALMLAVSDTIGWFVFAYIVYAFRYAKRQPDSPARPAPKPALKAAEKKDHYPDWSMLKYVERDLDTIFYDVRDRQYFSQGAAIDLTSSLRSVFGKAAPFVDWYPDRGFSGSDGNGLVITYKGNTHVATIHDNIWLVDGQYISGFDEFAEVMGLPKQPK